MCVMVGNFLSLFCLCFGFTVSEMDIQESSNVNEIMYEYINVYIYIVEEYIRLAAHARFCESIIHVPSSQPTPTSCCASIIPMQASQNR